MTLQQLRYIIALDDERHFARAAEAALISQPGLTTQLKNLEEEIGVKLFDRSRVPLVPTKEGEAIIARARKVLREADSIRELVVNLKESLEGTIRLGVISTVSPYLIPKFIREMKTVAPKIHLVVSERPTGLLVRDLESGQIDIALMATPTGEKGVTEHPVFREPFVAYLPEDDPQLASEQYDITSAEKKNLLLLHHEYCFNAQLLDICGMRQEKGRADTFSYDIASVETLQQMVNAGLGFAIVPELSVSSENRRRVREFPDPKPVREISLVTLESFPRQLLIEKMKEAIGNCLPEKLKAEAVSRRIKWNDSPYFARKMEQFK